MAALIQLGYEIRFDHTYQLLSTKHKRALTRYVIDAAMMESHKTPPPFHIYVYCKEQKSMAIGLKNESQLTPAVVFIRELMAWLKQPAMCTWTPYMMPATHCTVDICAR